MVVLRRPMKAPTDPIKDEELDSLTYPLVGSPKLDGFRCTVTDKANTSSMKSFGNRFVQAELSNSFYKGFDGEIIVGSPTDPDVFHNTSGPVRRFEGEPDFKFYVFDNLTYKDKPYEYRWLSALPREEGRIVVLEQRTLYHPEDVIDYEKEMLALGYEGAMIRSLNGSYKEGRCTFNEKNIFKRKPFVEIEGVVIGCIEALENLNEQEENELGLMKRSHKQENMVPKGTLGSLLIQAPKWKLPFSSALGKGYDDQDKLNIWNRRAAIIGTVVTVKYQLYGSRDAPRLPSVIKDRPWWDL